MTHSDPTHPDAAFEKRVKRQVTAREHRFFVVVAPGLVSVCENELKQLFENEKTIRRVEGGLEFDGAVSDGYRANLHLRTASRITMRIAEFSAADFQTLEKKCASIPWELFLSRNTAFDIRVTAKKSRLYHTDAVAERIGNVIRNIVPSDTPAQDRDQKLFVRTVKDRFEISLDSSGDLLYMRGMNRTGGLAPLRETLAAGLLMIAGYDRTLPLIDPMCGSGSFSLEAAMVGKNIPPGLHRNFAFMNWPCFRESAWRHILRTAETGSSQHPPEIYASDIDKVCCERFQVTAASSGFGDVIHITHRDFFDIDPQTMTFRKGLVILNPPYGLRIGSKSESSDLIRNIFSTLISRYKGWNAGVLSPFEIKTAGAPRYMKQLPVFHGGLTLHFIHGRIKS